MMILAVGCRCCFFLFAKKLLLRLQLCLSFVPPFIFYSYFFLPPLTSIFVVASFVFEFRLQIIPGVEIEGEERPTKDAMCERLVMSLLRPNLCFICG